MDDLSHNSAHLVGACGAGMKALAEVLLDANWSLSGSDIMPPGSAIRSMQQRGLIFHQGHQAIHLPQAVQQLIYSAAIPENNPERQAAKSWNIPQLSYGQMVGQLMRQSTGVCLAGTHGKSTTTAMTATILDAAQRLSAVVLGAELQETGRSGWSGAGDLFVAESCEFQRSFLDFTPRYAAILSVEADHVDCYPDLPSLTAAFREFADQVASDGILLVNQDCPNCPTISAEAATRAKRLSFGFTNSADWNAQDYQPTEAGCRFKLCHHGAVWTEIELALHGRHNAMNALAAAALCGEIGISEKIIRQSLAGFRGIKRRMEWVGDWNGTTFIDDYAHHPTAVKITLETIRQIVKQRRIRCVFQPHQVSRTLALMDDFAASFDAADEVWLAPIFAAREQVTDEPIRIAMDLANRINSRGVAARSFPSLDQIVRTLEDASCPGDVIVTMGAGDIDRIHHEFTRRI